MTDEDSAGLDVQKAELVTILEDHEADLELHSSSTASTQEEPAKEVNEIKLDFRGYEIKTLRLTVTGPARKRDSDEWIKL